VPSQGGKRKALHERHQTAFEIAVETGDARFASEQSESIEKSIDLRGKIRRDAELFFVPRLAWKVSSEIGGMCVFRASDCHTRSGPKKGERMVKHKMFGLAEKWNSRG
jgi:hypothetical protein